MNVDWAGTSLTNGRYMPGIWGSGGDGLLARFSELRERGEGYVEASELGKDYPWLTVSFRGDQAVVHLATAEETMALLLGDGSVEAGQVVEVPLYDEDAAFTG
jgi:hypothetical protein